MFNTGNVLVKGGKFYMLKRSLTESMSVQNIDMSKQERIANEFNK